MEEGRERAERRHDLRRSGWASKKESSFLSQNFTINGVVLAWPSKMSREIVPLSFWLKL